MGDGATVRWAEEFLARDHERPFFLAVGLFQPHLPFYAPRATYDAIGPGEAPVPIDKPGDLDDVPEPGRKMADFRVADLELILEHGDMEEVVRSYTACIRHADTLVGRVLGPHWTPVVTPITRSSCSGPIMATTSGKSTTSQRTPCGSVRHMCLSRSLCQA